MKTKDGQELNVIGQVQIENTLHFIVALHIPVYIHGRLTKNILLPITDFDVTNGAQEVEYV